MAEMTNSLGAALAARIAFPTETRPPWGFWGATAWGFAAIGLYTAVTLLTHLIMSSWRMVPLGLEVTAGTILGGVIELAVILLAIRYTCLPWRDYLALRRPELVDLLVGLACVLLLVGGYAVMDYFLGSSSPMRASGEVFRMLQAQGMLVPFLFATAVVAPIAEEIVFRGFLYRGWNISLLGVGGTIVLTSLVWAVLHMKPTLGLTLLVFCVGLLLGLVRWLTGSTTLVIGIHMANNFITVAWAL